MRKWKTEKKNIVALTAYDYSLAMLIENTSCIDIVLVGDSLGQVIQGHSSTIPVTVTDMIYHARHVRRAIKKSLLVVDLPFASYKISHEQGLKNCADVLQKTDADAIKLEGGDEIATLVSNATALGIPIIGHIGLMPQQSALTGYQYHGINQKQRDHLKKAADSLIDAGAVALVLELVEAETASMITETSPIPTIGIGSGPGTDGQILVLHDMLGITQQASRLRHNHIFAPIGKEIEKTIQAYASEVKSKTFPYETTYKSDKS